MSAADERRVRFGLAYALLQPCVVCGSNQTSTTGIFQPDAKHRVAFGGRPDKTRLIFYALCEPCYAAEGRNEAAEAAILRRAA
jgi:hypothetical protein